jgi:hypothetical protein
MISMGIVVSSEELKVEYLFSVVIVRAELFMVQVLG